MSEFLIDSIRDTVPTMLQTTLDEQTFSVARTFLTLALNEGLARGLQSGEGNRAAFVGLQGAYERVIAETIHLQTTETLDGIVKSQAADDEVARKPFVNAQAAVESVVTAHLTTHNQGAIDKAKSDSERLDVVKYGLVAHSIMIIHTPTPATPLILPGQTSSTAKVDSSSVSSLQDFMSPDVLKDKERLEVTLKRQNILRDYLAAGGIIVVAYEGKRRGARPLEEYEQLMAAYPAQIIDFPIDDAYLMKKEDGSYQYPLDKIGATYLLSDRAGHICDISNRGVQANDPRQDASWSLAIQDRVAPKPAANAVVAEAMDFLEEAGLVARLKRHFEKNNMDLDKYADLLGPYLNLKASAYQKHPVWQKYASNDVINEKVQTAQFKPK